MVILTSLKIETLNNYNYLKNFKIEKFNSSCNIGLASHENCLKAHNYIKFELEIIDEFINVNIVQNHILVKIN